jgi:hypothetical protein
LSKARENAIHSRLLQLILHWIVTFFQDFDFLLGMFGPDAGYRLGAFGRLVA